MLSPGPVRFRYRRLRGQIAVGLLVFAIILIGGGALLGLNDAIRIGAALGVCTLLFGANDLLRGLRGLTFSARLRRNSLMAPRAASKPGATPTPRAAPGPPQAPHAVKTAPPPHVLRVPWIIDGDTLDDRATGVRYRLENIDAPETDKRAQCDAERYMGNRAKWEAYNIIRAAQIVQAVPTGKIDAYGRIVAHIKVDGQDLGEIMIANGLALPWNGQRESWCGKGGNLHTLAMAHFKRPICQECALTRTAR